MTRVGWIGLGAMGSPTAACVGCGSFDTTAFDTTAFDTTAFDIDPPAPPH